MNVSVAAKPDFVLNYKKPPHTEIKKINGHWYLYEARGKYDPIKKRSIKISGRLLGKLTPDGLVESKARRREQERAAEPVKLVDVVEAGASAFFYERTESIRLRLQKYFPLCWQRIYVAALCRTVYDPQFKRLRLHYDNSILSHFYPDLKLDKFGIKALLDAVGSDRQSISRYMQESLGGTDRYVLFDGHRLLSSSRTLETADCGYDSKRRFQPQINVIYVFSLDEQGLGSPGYYKQYAGSTPDVSAFCDVLKEAGLQHSDFTVLADKGFASAANFAAMEEAGLGYVVPLRRGNLETRAEMPATLRDYDGLFSYRQRGIRCKTYDRGAYRLHLFFDASLYADELADLTARTEKNNAQVQAQRETDLNRRQKGQGRLTDADLAELVPQNVKAVADAAPYMGTITIRTNRLGLDGRQIYEIYKRRQAVEQFFKTYGASMSFEASYMRTRTDEEGWLFLNHLSATMGIAALEEVAAMGESKNLSLHDLIESLKKITAYFDGSRWHIAPIKKSVMGVFEKLKFSLSDAWLDRTVAVPGRPL